MLVFVIEFFSWIQILFLLLPRSKRRKIIFALNPLIFLIIHANKSIAEISIDI